MIQDVVITVERLADTSSDADKEDYQSIGGFPTPLMANIQPASPEDTAIADGVFGQTYKMFMTASGVLAHDKITVSGTNDTYIVKGIEDFNQVLISSYQFTLFKKEV